MRQGIGWWRYLIGQRAKVVEPEPEVEKPVTIRDLMQKACAITNEVAQGKGIEWDGYIAQYEYKDSDLTITITEDETVVFSYQSEWICFSFFYESYWELSAVKYCSRDIQDGVLNAEEKAGVIRILRGLIDHITVRQIMREDKQKDREVNMSDFLGTVVDGMKLSDLR